jgi:hypothetical protein|tara:strand:- start:536 stop:760 length:225 start_codon:yes stop_codon:yes gene_type:complete
MSDGKTEAMRGINFGYKIPSGDIKHMPNQKWHKIISFIKSGVRILGYCFIPFSLVTATILLILSEIIGIVEELV